MKVRDQLQDWPRIILGRNLVESVEIDNGPHSMTRVVLRNKLMADAKGQNAVKRDQAIEILKFTKEKGILMALKDEPAPLGPMARQAFFEVMYPKADVGAVPESPKAQNAGGAPAGFGGPNVIPIPHCAQPPLCDSSVSRCCSWRAGHPRARALRKRS